ncbi:MAG: type II toxin-antitoxin system Phd/YefM family antitoxin [Alphaproteobacteria bacterium]
MKSVSAADAKNKFGELIDAAQREPVTIEKHGRPVAVVMSQEEFEEIEALKLLWLKAEIQKGYDSIAAGRVIDGKTAFKLLRERIK